VAGELDLEDMTRVRKPQQRKLAAILMADVVGYSRLTARDEPGTLAEFRHHLDTYIRRSIRRWQGRLVKTTGDGLLVVFDSPVNAVECAAAIQKGAAKRNDALPPERRIQFRIGINFADVILEDDDVLGDGVNVAARLQTLAETGGIVVSQAVVQHVKGKTAVAFDDIGERVLKNIPSSVRVFRAGAPRIGDAAQVPTQAKLTIAVLPFVNMSGEADQRYFSDGITEDIITELSRFRTLAVIARTSSFVYRDQPTDVRQIAEALNVQFVVEGSVRRLDTRIRITVQLVNAESRRHVWAERYDVDQSEIFAVQDDVTRRVVATLVPRLETDELEMARRRPAADIRAYDCYLRGKALYYAAVDVSSRAKARAFFEQAVALDPEFARAYCYLAAIDNNLAVYAVGSAPLDDVKERARQFAVKAVALDDSDPLTHLSLAWSHLWRREFEATRLHLEIATRLNPNDADRAIDRGTTLMYLGEPEAAIEVMKAAMRLNPFHPESYLKDLAEAYFVARRYDDMLAIADRLSDTSPKFTAWKAAACAYAGREREARQHAANFLSRMSDAWPEGSPATATAFVSWLLSSCPFRRAEDAEHLMRGLQLAGVGGPDGRAPIASEEGPGIAASSRPDKIPSPPKPGGEG
jgi:TolB-like protein